MLGDNGARWGVLGHTGVYWGALEGDDQDRGSSGSSRTADTHLRPLHSLDTVRFLQRDGERSLLSGVSPEQTRHGGDQTGPQFPHWCPSSRTYHNASTYTSSYDCLQTESKGLVWNGPCGTQGLTGVPKPHGCPQSEGENLFCSPSPTPASFSDACSCS